MRVLYRYWEKLAKDRGMLVKELWQQIPGRGGDEGIKWVSQFYGSGAPWHYYWLHLGTGRCSWEWSGRQVCALSGVHVVPTVLKVFISKQSRDSKSI